MSEISKSAGRAIGVGTVAFCDKRQEFRDDLDFWLAVIEELNAHTIKRFGVAAVIAKQMQKLKYAAPPEPKQDKPS